MDFKFLDIIGQGSVGNVCLYGDLVIKIIEISDNWYSIEDFRRESENAVYLGRMGIGPKVNSVGICDQCYGYIVMEKLYPVNKSLFYMVDSIPAGSRILSDPTIHFIHKSLLVLIKNKLLELHQLGYTHRDLDLRYLLNIMNDVHGNLKFIDFYSTSKDYIDGDLCVLEEIDRLLLVAPDKQGFVNII